MSSEASLLRRTESVALNLDTEREEDTQPAAPAPAPASATEGPVERRIGAEGIDALRARLQRELAAKIDVSDTEPQPPQRFERIEAPRPERRRVETLRAEAQRNIVTAPERKTLGRFAGRRPSFRLRSSRLILLLVALIAGGAAAWLATRHEPAPGATVQTTQKAAPEVVQEPRARILVAKQTIEVGQRLADGVDWEDWPKGAIRPEYVTNSATPNALTDMSGAVARFEIFPGEPIRTDKLAVPGQGYLSAVLDAGMRGVSVAITPESASGGFVLPDDHVDVLLTRNADNKTETILHNVRVMAINARLGDSPAAAAAVKPEAAKDANDKDGSKVFTDHALATLELDSAQTEVVINATSLGKLSLVLRALTDFPKTDAGAQPTLNEAIRMTSPFWVK